MSYSKDIRERALAACEEGYDEKTVTEIFGLGQHTLWSWRRLQKETGSLENRPLDRKPRKIPRDELLNYYKEHPDATNAEAAEHFGCSKTGIFNAKKAMKITRKKNKKL